MALGHADVLKEIHHVLSLRQEEAIRGTGNGDPEEVMKVPKICHGELRVQAVGDAAKKISRRRREDEVVDVEQQVGNTAALFVDRGRCPRPRRRSPECGCRWRSASTTPVAPA